MSDGTVRIDELRLRIPATSAEDGRAIAAQVMELVAEGLPETPRAGRFDELELRIRANPGVSRNRLAEIIARAILDRI